MAILFGFNRKRVRLPRPVRETAPGALVEAILAYAPSFEGRATRLELLMTLLVGGHCLITGMPGTAKTLLVRTLADALGRFGTGDGADAILNGTFYPTEYTQLPEVQQWIRDLQHTEAMRAADPISVHLTAADLKL